jgi:hypothetical protein
MLYTHCLSSRSKNEYVRCLAVTGPHCIYVATNRGYLYRVDLEGENDTWHPLIDPNTEPGGPIVSLVVRVQQQSFESERGATETGGSGRQVSPSNASNFGGGVEAISGRRSAGKGLPSDGNRGKSEARQPKRGGERRGERHSVLWGDYLGRATAAYFTLEGRSHSGSVSEQASESRCSGSPKAEAGAKLPTEEQIRTGAGLGSEESHTRLDEKNGDRGAEIGRSGESEGNGSSSAPERQKWAVQDVSRAQWQAHELRNLLGVFWADALGYENAFTTDGVGGVSWWKVDGVDGGRGAVLLGRCQSPFWIRVVCLTVDEELEVGSFPSSVVFCSFKQTSKQRNSFCPLFFSHCAVLVYDRRTRGGQLFLLPSSSSSFCPVVFS